MTPKQHGTIAPAGAYVVIKEKTSRISLPTKTTYLIAYNVGLHRTAVHARWGEELVRN
jgi:hypothetical protein